MIYRWLLFIMLSMCVNNIFSQKIERVHGEYTYYVPENISLDEGKRTALERAKIQALSDAFGTIVSQSNSTIVKSDNGKSDVDFLSLGGSDVKGEWIETIGEPKFNIFYDKGMLVVNVSVEGKARAITTSGIDLDVKVLRNGTDIKYESDEFHDGDDLYLYFKSPVNGYLAAYLLDESTQEVFCLLPYRSSGEPAYKITHDKPYIFVSAEKDKESQCEVDEYTMTCEKAIEQNTLYIIFSPNLFAKANTENGNNGLPRLLELNEFRKWLGKCKTKDTLLQERIFQITIKKS